MLVEHARGALLPQTLGALTAARQLLGKITALVAGGDAASLEPVAKAVAATEGVDEVRWPTGGRPMHGHMPPPALHGQRVSKRTHARASSRQVLVASSSALEHGLAEPHSTLLQLLHAR